MSAAPCRLCLTRPGREGGRLCTSCTSNGLSDAPIYCPCPTSDFDAIGQCRRCRLADLRAPQFAESRARLDAALAAAAPT